jgi:hypothetical protein
MVIKSFSKNWYISDWIPRIPGELWKSLIRTDGTIDDLYRHFENDRIPTWVRGEIQKRFEHTGGGILCSASVPLYSWSAKNALVLGGLGSLRLPLQPNNPEHFACLGAVTTGGWLTDLGIPVVVSEQVYREFDRSRSSRTVAVEADLRGHVVLGSIPDEFTHTPRGNAPQAFTIPEALLRHPTDLPLAYVHVTSPLDCDFRSNDTHPKSHAWTLFRCRNQADASKGEEPTINHLLSGIGAYGLTFTPFQPDVPADVERAVAFLKGSPALLHMIRAGATELVERYHCSLSDTLGRLEIELLTDFDGLVPRLGRATFQLGEKSRQSGLRFIGQMRRELDEFDKDVEVVWATSLVRDRHELLNDLASGFCAHDPFFVSPNQTYFACDNCHAKLKCQLRSKIPHSTG